MAATSLFDVLRNHARRAGGTLAAVDGIVTEDIPTGAEGDATTPLLQWARLSYAELCERAERLAAVLSMEHGRSGTWEDFIMATWMRRGNRWYCLFCAAARLQAPVVALSADLSDRDVERVRNVDIMASHRPALIVVDRMALSESVLAASPATAVEYFNDLWQKAHAPRLQRAPETAASLDATLCFCYTGGTTKASRCARVTHRMALHEVATYPLVVDLGPEDRVLQQHSVYWAASAYGELDIALAFGCALVFCEAFDAEAVAAAIRGYGATCAGLVPTFLAALAPEDVPTLQHVFTWGEALQSTVAQEWARHVHLVDLLISTECWLSLYADWGRTGSDAVRAFHILPGARAWLRPLPEEQPGSNKGELLVAGPMVSPGYTDRALTAEAFCVDGEGVCWYCTKDVLMQREDGGLVFAGRADDLVKVGGAWLDMREVERSILATHDASEACFSGSDAFVALRSLHDGTVARLRAALPSGFTLHLLPALPRKPGTGKVDRRALQDSLQLDLVDMLEEREIHLVDEELRSLVRWYWPLMPMVLMALVWAMLDEEAEQQEAVVVVCVRWLRELVMRLLPMTYLLLLFWTSDTVCREWFQGWWQHVPLKAHGAIVMLCAVLPGPWCCFFAALPGAINAKRRQRLLSWPLVCLIGFPFWVREGNWWMRDESCFGVLRWYGGRLPGLPNTLATVKKKVSWTIRKHLGYIRECKHCRNLKARGHVEPEVSREWYCEACWRHYHAHKQCCLCQEWTARGVVSTKTGLWVCTVCEPQNDGNASAEPGANGAARGGGWGARGGWGGRGGGRIERRVISLSLPAPASPAPAVSPSPGGKRPLTPNGSRQDKRPRMDGPASEDPANKSREWRVIEESTNMTFGSLSSSLLSLDSLRHTKLTSALRRQLGKRLPREALKRASTLGELLREVEQLPEEPLAPSRPAVPTSTGSSGDAARGEFAIWGMMWHGKCRWMFRRSRPLAEAHLRCALEQLMERHVALRAELQDHIRLFDATQKALTALDVWRRPRGQSANSRFAQLTALPLQALGSLVRWCFRHSWPRVRAREGTRHIPLKVLGRCATEEEAERRIWPRGGDDFVPPFEARMVAFGQEREEGALVHLTVTHMLSDGFCVVPLLEDLAHLVACAEGALLPPLHPIPSSFALLESRLWQTIQGYPKGALHGGITREAVHGKRWHVAVCVFASVPAEVVAAIRRIAARLGVPEDIVMLAAVGITLAWMEAKESFPLAMIVPQRDGPGENEVLGLFADIRHFNVCTGRLSFAGVALRLHHTIKERRWGSPGVATQYDVPLVNFEWTDLTERHGFAQRVYGGERDESSLHPLRVAVDQPDCEGWRLRVAFSKKLYSQKQRSHFFDLLTEALQKMMDRPLDLVWDPRGDAAAGGHGSASQ